jgi:MYXO-CTERM domain-containing protein
MWTRTLGAILVVSSLSGLGTLPASAQNNADNQSGVETRTADEGFDLGWLGLIGLAGLLGLRRRDDVHSNVRATTNR